MPGRQEAPERGLLRGLDLLAQCRERRSPQPPEDIGVAPLALDSARPKLAPDELVGALEPVSTPRRRRLERYRAAASAVVKGHAIARTARAAAQRVGHRVEKCLGEPARRHHAERIAEEPGVLAGDQPLLACDPHPESAPLRLEHSRVRRVELVVAEIATSPEQVVELVG